MSERTAEVRHRIHARQMFIHNKTQDREMAIMSILKLT